MKRIIVLGAVVLLVIVLWSGAWFWAAGQATAYVKTLETADGVTTPRVACRSLGIGGFPFGFDLTCTGATIALADTSVTVSGLKAAALVYRPTFVLLFAQSPVTIADAFTGSQRRLDFADAEASARLDGWRIGRVSLVVNAPVWNDVVLEDRLIARADRLEAHLIDVPAKHDAKAGLAALAEYAQIDGLVAPGLEIVSGKTIFEGEITNLPDDVRTYGDPDLLMRWQTAGGKFMLTGFKGDDIDSHFDVAGTLGLDTQGRVEGQLKLNSKGVVERLGPLIPEQFRGLILGGQAADGSYSQTVNIAAGVVFSGLVPAAVIPPLY
ncbi:MAG: DUF2125 domain-containing protein [Devosia nanyangense]|uniref:DUF2125 domain-containing protein n=1 Tax=Devosia nanyangense TaxID=1228055 RepID=A0A933L629_9HYPH|nr:DUF2125 domain-containing protein [Devosia nanyangense]